MTLGHNAKDTEWCVSPPYPPPQKNPLSLTRCLCRAFHCEVNRCRTANEVALISLAPSIHLRTTTRCCDGDLTPCDPKASQPPDCPYPHPIGPMQSTRGGLPCVNKPGSHFLANPLLHLLHDDHLVSMPLESLFSTSINQVFHNC